MTRLLTHTHMFNLNNTSKKLNVRTRRFYVTNKNTNYKHMNRLFVTLLVVCLGLLSQAQVLVSDTLTQKVIWTNNVGADTLIQRTYTKYKDDVKISGYRIQIYSGTSLSKANKIKALFMITYPAIESYLIYQQPSFKVRVGDYHNRLEANKFYHILLDNPDFRSVFLVPDLINLPELKYVQE